MHQNTQLNTYWSVSVVLVNLSANLWLCSAFCRFKLCTVIPNRKSAFFKESHTVIRSWIAKK